MGCGLPLGAFGRLLPGVPPSVDPGVLRGVLPEPDSPPCGGSGGGFFLPKMNLI